MVKFLRRIPERPTIGQKQILLWESLGKPKGVGKPNCHDSTAANHSISIEEALMAIISRGGKHFQE